MKTIRRRTFWLLPLLFLTSWIPSLLGGEKAQPSRAYWVYVGTYTNAKSQGIYLSRFDAASGRLTAPELVAETTNPSFLAIDPGHHFLYAVTEGSKYQGQNAGAVSAFAMDRKTGKLTFLNQVTSRGAGPCHLSLDKTGKYVLVANYGGGSVAVLPVFGDGRLSEASAFVQHQGHSANPERQEGPHAHSIGTSLDNRFVLTADLGLDEVLVYRFGTAKGTLMPNAPPFGKVPAGAGPRHFAFSPNGRFVYVINEMGSSVTAFSYTAAQGLLKELQTVSTLPADFKGKSTCAEIAVHPSGKFVYGSNRGHDSIAVFAADLRTGMLTPVEIVSTRGKEPRNFALDPTGSFLIAANQNSDTLVVFRVGPQSGKLTPTGQVVNCPTPVCITFVPIE